MAPLGFPPIPPTGWKAVTETNFRKAVEEMPRMMSGNFCMQSEKKKLHDKFAYPI